MAFTDFSRTDFSSVVPGVGGQELTEEEKRRRQQIMSGTTGFQDVASQYLNNRLDQAQQNIQNAGQFITNPQQVIQERISNAPVAPAQPQDRKSTRLNSSHTDISRMPSSA